MDVNFNCPHCDQELEVDSGGAGQSIECPSCGESIVIPVATAANIFLKDYLEKQNKQNS